MSLTVEEKNELAAPVVRGWHQYTELEQGLALCMRGLEWGQHAVYHSEAATELPEYIPVGSIDRQLAEQAVRIMNRPIDEPEHAEAFARRESVLAYPFIYGLGAISFCTIAEAMVSDLARERIRINPSVLTGGENDALKISVVEFVQSTPEQRTARILELLKANVRSGKNLFGIRRFEELLKRVGLGGQLHTTIDRVLKELFAVRNVLVHSAGQADEEFARTSTLSQPVQVGSGVLVSGPKFMLLGSAFCWYVSELFHRISELHEPNPEWRRFQSIYLEKVEKKLADGHWRM